MDKGKIEKSCVTLLTFFLFISASGFAANNSDDEASEQTSNFTYGSEIDLNSRYLWRGITWSENFVGQPSVWVSYADFTGTVWGNFFFDDADSRVGCNEVDFILAFIRELAKLSIEPSFSYYLYFNQEDAPGTGEIALKLSYPVGPFSVFTDQTFDIVRYAGAYFGDLGFSYEHELSSKLSLDAAFKLGCGSARFNDTYIGVSKNAFNLTEMKVSLPYYVSGKFYVCPHLELDAVLDRDLYDLLGHYPTNYGLTLGIEL